MRLAILGIQNSFILGRQSVPAQRSAVSSVPTTEEQYSATDKGPQNSTEVISEVVAEATVELKEEQAPSLSTVISDNYFSSALSLEDSPPSKSNGGNICVTVDDFDYRKTAAGGEIIF